MSYTRPISDEQFEMILEDYVEGMPIKKALASRGLNLTTFSKYLTLDDRLRQYTICQKFKAEIDVDETIEIADGDDNPFKAKNRIEARQWRASKYNSTKYGDKLDLTVSENLDLRGVLESAKNRSRLVTQVVETVPQIQRAATDGQSVDRENSSADAAALAKMLS